MKTTIKWTALVVLAALAGWWFYHYTATQDAHREIEAARYERCVSIEYPRGTTPASYYIEHNEYPPCNPDRIACNIAEGEDPTACQARLGDYAEVIENETTGDYWGEVH